MFALLATLALAAATVCQAQANCDRIEVVESGDTCNTFSAKYNVSSYQLALVNTDIINPACDNLVAGERICLGLTDQDCMVTYIVNSGDSCLQIASKFNIPEITLLTNNNLTCNHLYSGEVLCVDSKVYRYTTRSA